MLRSLLLIVSIFFIGSALGQEQKHDADHKGTETKLWKSVTPEKLKYDELMILPSNRFLRLNLKDDPGFTKVLIQDLNGNILLQKPYDPGRDIDISVLKPGNYLIKVISANRVLQGKFGKRRL